LTHDWLLTGKGPIPVLPVPGRRRRRAVNDPDRGASSVLSDPPIFPFKCAICPPPPPGEWIVPSYALPIPATQAAVFKVVAGLKSYVKSGDYIFLDQTEQKIRPRGLWLVQLKGVATPVVIYARMKRQRNRAVIEIQYDDMSFPATAVKNVFGRIVATFSPTI
jgi:hypothetical protein